jgi:hypothetical protein
MKTATLVACLLALAPAAYAKKDKPAPPAAADGVLAAKDLGSESITAKCPDRWQVKRFTGAGGPGWQYFCQVTGTEITIGDGDGRTTAGLKGSVKGDKSASWKR